MSLSASDCTRLAVVAGLHLVTASDLKTVFDAVTAISAGTAAVTCAGLTDTGALTHTGTTVGFYSTTPIAKQTGVVVSAAGIHAALVALGLIAA